MLNLMETTCDSEAGTAIKASKHKPWALKKTDPLDAEISAYDSILNKEPSDTTTLRKLLDSVKRGEWRESIEAIREAYENGGKE